MNKILTIVVPVYNMERYLSKCLNSLILKDKDLMNDLEVIIVNDGSKDNSLNIMKTYESNYPNIFYVIDKLNGGHGSACNVGLSLAHGKFIRFLDSDDWLDENNFPVYLKRLKHEESQVVETPLIYEYVLNNKTVTVKKQKVTYDKTYNINDLEVYKTFDNSNYCVFSIHEDTFRTDILRKYVKFREKVVYDDNILGLVGVFELQKISFYDLPLYHYLNGREGQTMSHKVMVKNFNCIFFQAEDMISIYDRYYNTLNSNANDYAKSIIMHFIDHYYSQALFFFKATEYRKVLDSLNLLIMNSSNKRIFSEIPTIKLFTGTGNNFYLFYFKGLCRYLPLELYKRFRRNIGGILKIILKGHYSHKSLTIYI